MRKKGWIQIVEAFMAISILLGFLMTILSYVDYERKDSALVSKRNFEILRGIETNSSLRHEVFLSDFPSNSVEEDFSPVLKSYLNGEVPVGEVCILYVCELESVCLFEGEVAEEIYSSEILFFAESNSYFPRKLKLFCYDE